MQNDLKIRENHESFGGCHTEGPSAAYIRRNEMPMFINCTTRFERYDNNWTLDLFNFIGACRIGAC